MKRFEDRTVVISGGTSGIGRATALRFANEGAKVAILARTPSGGRDVVEKIEAKGGVAGFFQVDVSEPEQVEAAMNAVIDRFGSFQIAFNCSGMSGEARLLHQIEHREFDRIVKTNLYGVYYCMKQEIAHFLAQGAGVIVNCASTSGLVGFPALAAYTASKHAVVGLTKSAALDYATQGIRINAICPGGIKTTMLAEHLKKNPGLEKALHATHPIGRMGNPDEVAGLVLWLCSDESTNIIGQAYAVDGGYTVP